MLRAATLAALAVLGLSGCGNTPAAPRAGAVLPAPAGSPAKPVPVTHPPHRAVTRLPRRTHPRSVEVPILTYHRVHSYATEHTRSIPRLTVEPRVFSEEMAALVRSGHHTISQRQLYAAMFAGGRLPPRPVMITADDGYEDDATQMLPVLRRLNLEATFYIVSGRIGQPGFVNAEELRRLERAGMDIGAHTRTHADLTQLPPRRAREEIAGSARDLRHIVGAPVPWFAYPFGAVNPEVVRMVEAAGFALATTTRGGARELPSAPLQLPRLEVGREMTPAGLIAELGTR